MGKRCHYKSIKYTSPFLDSAWIFFECVAGFDIFSSLWSIKAIKVLNLSVNVTLVDHLRGEWQTRSMCSKCECVCVPDTLPLSYEWWVKEQIVELYTSHQGRPVGGFVATTKQMDTQTLQCSHALSFGPFTKWSEPDSDSLLKHICAYKELDSGFWWLLMYLK